MDPKATFTVGTVVGALLWEVIKQAVAYFSKRKIDSQDSKRKMLREDIEKIIGLICEIHETSISYYATEFDTDAARDLSKQIKAKTKTVGMKLTAVNTQLSDLDKGGLDIVLWTRFKTASAQHLDVKRTDIWNDDDPRLTEIYKAAHHMHSSLNKIRYANT
jgi:citrate lyase gamma subunit